jgi:hypothetical protein
MWNNFHVIGWDAGLNTFYLQLNAHREEPSPWYGTSHSEYADPQPLVDKLRQHFEPEGRTPDETQDWDEIPPDLYDTLIADRQAEPGWELPSEEVVQAALAALPPKRRTFWQKLVGR